MKLFFPEWMGMRRCWRSRESTAVQGRRRTCSWPRLNWTRGEGEEGASGLCPAYPRWGVFWNIFFTILPFCERGEAIALWTLGIRYLIILLHVGHSCHFFSVFPYTFGNFLRRCRKKQNPSSCPSWAPPPALPAAQSQRWIGCLWRRRRRRSEPSWPAGARRRPRQRTLGRPKRPPWRSLPRPSSRWPLWPPCTLGCRQRPGLRRIWPALGRSGPHQPGRSSSRQPWMRPYMAGRAPRMCSPPGRGRRPKRRAQRCAPRLQPR